MKLRRIIAAAGAAAIALSALAATTISAGAMTLPGAKFVLTPDGYIDGVLSKNGTLYIYDGEFNRQTVASDVEDAFGHFFIKKGKLYNRLTMTSVMSNVDMSPFANVIMTTSGGHYFIVNDKVIKPPKKVLKHAQNSFGDFVLFTSDKGWDGAYFSVYPNGVIDYSEPDKDGDPRTQRTWYSLTDEGKLEKYAL